MIAARRATMARVRHALDGQPGRLPEVRVKANDIIFTMTPPGTGFEARLLIRCDADGELWISLQPEGPGEPK
jgi:hypothetical protein